jgi:hypothetical protein
VPRKTDACIHIRVSKKNGERLQEVLESLLIKSTLNEIANTLIELGMDRWRDIEAQKERVK